MTSKSTAARSRARRVQGISAPLGFYVLALLIVEAFLASVLIGADLNSPNKIIGMWAGVGMWAVVVGMVTVLVWYKPEHLTFDQAAHLESRSIQSNAQVSGTKPKPKPAAQKAKPKPSGGKS